MSNKEEDFTAWDHPKRKQTMELLLELLDIWGIDPRECTAITFDVSDTGGPWPLVTAEVRDKQVKSKILGKTGWKTKKVTVPPPTE